MNSVLGNVHDVFTKYLVERGPIWVTNFFVSALILLLGYFAAKYVSHYVKKILIQRKAETVAPIVAALVKVAFMGASFVTALSHVGIDVGAVLAGAGVLGLAVGFGAQALVKDLISGFFLIFDDVISSGDSIKTEQAEGVVESVGLRMTRIRAFDGRLWFVPNGSINIVSNSSRNWARAIVEVAVPYTEDTEKVLYLLKQVADSVAAEKKSSVLEAPEAQGILSLGESSLTVRVHIKVKPEEKGDIEILLRRRVKEAFAQAGVAPPFPRRVVSTFAPTQ